MPDSGVVHKIYFAFALSTYGMGRAFGPKTMSLREFASGFDPLD